MIKIGERLPDFILKDHKGNIVDSKEFAGKNILLGFHPLAYTGVCEKQMREIDENYDFFRNLGFECFGVSIDTTFSKNIWAKNIELKSLRLLSDFWPHGELAIKLGIFRGNEGFSERATIIADKNGIVRFVKVYDIPELPDINEIKKEAEKIGK